MNVNDDMEQEFPFKHVTFVGVRVKFWGCEDGSRKCCMTSIQFDLKVFAIYDFEFCSSLDCAD